MFCLTIVNIIEAFVMNNLDMSNADFNRYQTEAFFRAASNLWQAARDGDRALIWGWRDEIEVIEIHANSATLRDRCARTLAAAPVVEKPRHDRFQIRPAFGRL
jgi:hypothetical protein